ncbi:hypothetical protein [Agromyces rhizosphaerae]|uniref:hypothetical protein n=1 Tax=Agromyces rhizosphaerae TaxID=88374 RepID=UPI0024937593|nr:hypothetical protein [Agromyces rhizosphaerae]
MTDAPTTWRHLAGMLSVDELIAVGDYLVSPRGSYGDLPALTEDEALQRSIERTPRLRGAARARDALVDVRAGARSPKETEARLMLCRAGLPEPVLNHPVVDEKGELIAEIDLAYPDDLLGVEYEGDSHRERERFRRDIRRIERLQDAGWHMIRLTSDDVDATLTTTASRDTVERIERRLRMSRT